MSNIRNMDAYSNSFWDWSFLNGAFGGSSIKVSDVDGMVERGGNFLMIEGKKGGLLSPGQKIMYRSWVNRGNAFLLLSGMDHDDKNMVIYAAGGPWPQKGAMFQGKQDTVRQLCGDWYQWANAHKKEQGKGATA